MKPWQVRVVHHLRGWIDDLEPDGARKAAELIFAARGDFLLKDGRPDWAGRSWAYRQAIREVYGMLGLPSSELPSVQSAVRYHVGEVARERLTDEELEDYGLLQAGPRQRARKWREESREPLTDFEAWVRHGVRQGWIGEPWCYVHAAPELTDEEQAIIDDNEGDMDAICVFAVRIKEA